MTAALTVVGASLQLVLYRSLADSWFALDLPMIVATSFAFSMIVGVVTEIRRLIGGPLLTSVLLGTYHRPTRRRLIVMFLDLANSTRLAEAMGELKVHDLITRFFFDIDEPIAEFGGAVHAYVGDEVIVSWPVSDDPSATRAASPVSSPSNAGSRASRPTTRRSSASFRPSGPESTPAPSSSANAATPSASSPISATR